jgi:hypothetical protein
MHHHATGIVRKIAYIATLDEKAFAIADVRYMVWMSSAIAGEQNPTIAARMKISVPPFLC